MQDWRHSIENRVLVLHVANSGVNSWQPILSPKVNQEGSLSLEPGLNPEYCWCISKRNIEKLRYILKDIGLTEGEAPCQVL